MAGAFNPKSDISDGRWALIDPIVARLAEALADNMATPIELAPAAAAAANASLADAVAESAGNPKAIAADAWADAEAEAAAPAPDPEPNFIANCNTAGGKENDNGGRANNGPNCAITVACRDNPCYFCYFTALPASGTIRYFEDRPILHPDAAAAIHLASAVRSAWRPR